MSKFDVLNINPAVVEQAAEFTWTESDWMVMVDGPTQTAWEVNRKTGERRPVDYDEAIRAIPG